VAAWAAPVVVGMMFSAAARRRRGFAVGAVDEVLGAGVGVDGRQLPGLDAELLVEHLGDGRDGVGRTGGVGDDVLAVVLVLVDAVDELFDRFVALRRGGDDDLVRAGFEVLACVLVGAEDSRRLEGDVDVEFAPGEFARVGLVEDAGLEVGAVDGERAVAQRGAVTPAQHRVVLREVLELLVLHDVVDPNDVDGVALSMDARKTFRPMRPKPFRPTRTGSSFMTTINWVQSE